MHLKVALKASPDLGWIKSAICWPFFLFFIIIIPRGKFTVLRSVQDSKKTKKNKQDK